MSTDADPQFYSPSDAAVACGCCAATTKRLADELHLPAFRTRGGVRLFPATHVEKIRAELQRRKTEALR